MDAHERPAHQRRRHRGRGPAGAAARAARRPRRRARRDRARTATARRRRARSRRAARSGSRRSTFDDGTVGYATDGTPVDCVRFGQLGLVEGFEADLIVVRASTTARTSATTSPTRARSPRRSRASCSGCPAIAVSQQSARARAGLPLRPRASSFDARRRRSRRGSSPSSTTCRCRRGTLLNVNVPAGEPDGRRGHAAGQADLPRRARARHEDAGDGRRRYWIYGDDPGYARGAGHRPRRGRGRADRGHAGPLRPDRPSTGSTRSTRYDLAAAARAGAPASCE